ncbi:hypothetical protein OK016_14935 [Vibrio chagasii]|nr:hypothetical protein [Vibrio chagasii]
MMKGISLVMHPHIAHKNDVGEYGSLEATFTGGHRYDPVYLRLINGCIVTLASRERRRSVKADI